MESANKNIYFHVGISKTGSTFLQKRVFPRLSKITYIPTNKYYRVFEEIVAFSSQAYVISLQWLTYDFLIPDETGNRLINRASTSAMLTMVGVSIIITPLLKRTWEDYRDGKL